ncbi:MAG: hypothetical protein MUF38_14300 [Anaerolineae bacterium]|jgi:hypothetical protein|nr:hypothetical protein [Anaerolineae bacterium]
MTKPIIIPNWKYQKPSKGGYKGLKKLLKYVSYRESPDHRPVDLNNRWTDCGLGSGWREVYDRAGKLSGPYVLAHHLVIAPAPDLMELVPEELRQELVREVTERTIESWFEARGLNIPEYSFVTHDRDTDDDYGLQNLHTHVFVAGTVENSIGERESHRVQRQQVCTDRGGLNREDNLHHIARQEFEYLLDRTIGPEWRRLREVETQQPTLTANRDDDPFTVRPSPEIDF